MDGKVLYDNVSGSLTMENHSGREKIIEALTGGAGKSDRVSVTLGENTYYYSKKLSDGNILRVCKTTSSIYGVFMQSLPVSILIVLLILIFSHFLARSLAKKITKPINDIDRNTNTAAYDELSPLIRTITHQKEQINRQISEPSKGRGPKLGLLKTCRRAFCFLIKQGQFCH